MTDLPRKKVTNPELRELFIAGKCEEQICKKVPYYDKPTPVNRGYPPGTRTVGHECYNRDGKYIGLLFRYQQPNGQPGDPSPKEFLIDGTWHYV